MASRFDYVVFAIEELMDLTTMSNEALQSSLKAYKKRNEERDVDKAKAEIALQARSNERDKKAKGMCPMNIIRGNFRDFSGRESQNSKKKINISKG